MKSIIVVLGITGSLTAFSLGLLWLGDYYQNKATIDQDLHQTIGSNEESTRNTITDFQDTGIASYLMLMGALLSFAASFTIEKFGKLCAIIMIASALFPAFFTVASLLGTALLIPAGLLILLAKNENRKLIHSRF